MNDDQPDRLHNLLFGVRRSARYHARRVRFYRRFDKTVRVLTVISGAGVITAAMADAIGDEWVKVFAAIVAGVAAIDLVIGSTTCAVDHERLRQRFIELERRIVLAGDQVAAEAIDGFIAERLAIEMTEPPILRTLDILCHNELARAMGCDESEQKPVPWLNRRLADFLDFGPVAP
jgi:hypothetical protein